MFGIEKKINLHYIKTIDLGQNSEPLKEVQKQACLVTHLTESMTKTTSSIVILVSAMFVERIICNREKKTNLLNDKVNTPAKQLSGMPVADHVKLGGVNTKFILFHVNPQ